MLLRVIKSIAIGIPVGVTLFDYVGYVARVEGISMQPCLNPTGNGPTNDYVFLSRLHDFHVRKGEIISCISPKNRAQMIIKRVTAVEGDIVKSEKQDNRYIKVPEGHCWIEGDHRSHSLDSNTFGPIPNGLVVARAMCIVWPPERWQLL